MGVGAPTENAILKWNWAEFFLTVFLKQEAESTAILYQKNQYFCDKSSIPRQGKSVLILTWMSGI